MPEISRFRGDTKPIKFTVWQDKDAGIPYDFTGCSLLLTVDPAKDPVDDTNNLFSLVSSFVTDGTDGKILFQISELQADITPGTYYYDIQLEDADNNKSTLFVDKFKIKQDITKA